MPGFPDELKILLEHLIISHHGQYEFGSPKLPMFPEVLMLHYLDDLDSKMEAMRAQFEREADLDSAWTGYNPSLARPLLNTQKFLDKSSAKSKKEEAPKPATPAADDFAESSSKDDEVSTESAPGETQSQSAPAAASQAPAASPLDALQRKFESHRITPVANKTN